MAQHSGDACHIFFWLFYDPEHILAFFCELGHISRVKSNPSFCEQNHKNIGFCDRSSKIAIF